MISYFDQVHFLVSVQLIPTSFEVKVNHLPGIHLWRKNRKVKCRYGINLV